jgi:Glycosyltransferase sugar-binding region containing DXD motif
MNRVMQSLWIGNELSTMERLSITSFLAHGHEFDLYTYGPVGGVPKGVRLRDAVEIIPCENVFGLVQSARDPGNIVIRQGKMIVRRIVFLINLLRQREPPAEYEIVFPFLKPRGDFRSQDHPSYAVFADFFRYKLLLEKGGWWVDLDAVCLKPFDFDAEYVFASERTRDGREVPTNAFIKAPPGSSIMSALWRICQAKDPARITWGDTGPRLIEQNIRRFGLEANVQRSHVFCPLDFFEWQRSLDPTATWSFPDSTRAIHLWNEMWRRAGKEKDAPYHSECLYENLRAKYRIQPVSNG